MRHVIVHGLRRSGTTILWETLRGDARLRCYDEPFHPRLAAGARENHKGTWTEFAALLPGHPLSPAPILPEEELLETSSPEQVAWLGSLCAEGQGPAAIDIVRGWNRAPALHGGCGEVLGVHLVRDPASWAAAHLTPSGGRTWRQKAAGIYRRASFFKRRGFYDGYQYETIIDAALAAGHPVMSHVGLSMQELSASPAHVKLLAFWWGANRTLARRLSGTGHLTVTLSEFSRAPMDEVERIAAAAGWPAPQVDVSPVRVGRPAFGEDSPRWIAAARRLGLPEALFGPEGRQAGWLARTFAEGAP